MSVVYPDPHRDDQRHAAADSDANTNGHGNKNWNPYTVTDTHGHPHPNRMLSVWQSVWSTAGARLMRRRLHSGPQRQLSPGAVPGANADSYGDSAGNRHTHGNRANAHRDAESHAHTDGDPDANPHCHVYTDPDAGILLRMQ